MDVHPPKNGINRYWSIPMWLYPMPPIRIRLQSWHSLSNTLGEVMCPGRRSLDFFPSSGKSNWNIMMEHIILYYIVLYFILYWIVFYSIILYYTILYHIYISIVIISVLSIILSGNSLDSNWQQLFVEGFLCKGVQARGCYGCNHGKLTHPIVGIDIYIYTHVHTYIYIYIVCIYIKTLYKPF